LVFSSEYPRSSCITKIRADGSEEPTSLHFCGVPYAQTEPYPTGPEMSPDGKKIVFNDPYLGLHTLDADGENLKSIGVGGFAPSWQPVVR